MQITCSIKKCKIVINPSVTFGRVALAFHPAVESLTDSITVFNPVVNTFVPPTMTDYDVLDRTVRVQLPTGDVTTTAYGFGTHNGKTYFQTATTDPLGTTVRTLTNTIGLTVKQSAPLGAVTTFTYDPIGQLLSSTDPGGLTTTHTYDMLGRRTQRTHPDAGTDRWTYDPAGNMLTHQTQLLYNANKSVSYHYTYSRLDSITYPDNPKNNVRYTYGDSTAAGNAKGRVTLLEDASGWQSFKYGKMGEVIENNRTFVLPKEDSAYSFKMTYEYDSWNRIQKIIYPDSEVVCYTYGLGGDLRSVYGLSGSSSWTYISDIHYDEFGNRLEVWNGNGTRSVYGYDMLQRLNHLTLLDHNNTPLQDIMYTYDGAGNILNANNLAAGYSSIGGLYSNWYTYDSLHRLATSMNSTGGTTHYLSMNYLPDGRISSKYITANSYIDGAVSTTTKTMAYTYKTRHSPSQVVTTAQNYSPSPPVTYTTTTVTYIWDANGNMTQARETKGKIIQTQTFAWDEENRLTNCSAQAKLGYYLYDANGERFYKCQGANTIINQNGKLIPINAYNNPVLYVSQYLVVTPTGYTKHYYVGNERVASRIGAGRFYDLNSHCVADSLLGVKRAAANTGLPSTYYSTNSFTYLHTLTGDTTQNAPIYWTHGDHLGSTAWVTDIAGVGVQHFRYLPFGEPLYSKKTGTFSSRYTFSGKERDAESGLNYFGARYYNSDLSIWISVDPLADKYPNLSPYTYCADNPVRLVDPEGRDVYFVGDDNDRAIEHLQNHNEEGKLEYAGTPKTKIDKMLVAAIDDEDISVFITTDKSNSFGGISSETGGAYMGNFFENGKVCTDQYVCPSMLEKFDKSVGDNKPGLTMIHELAESYYGGKIALERKHSSPHAGISGSTYNEAHLLANQIVIGNKGPVYLSININGSYLPQTKSSYSKCSNGKFSLNVLIGWKRTTNKEGM